MNREITDYATTQMKGTIEEAGGGTRQLLEDMQASPYEINAIRTLSVTKGLDPAQPFILSLCQVTVDTMAFPWLSFRPKPKSKAGKKRKRKADKNARDGGQQHRG